MPCHRDVNLDGSIDLANLDFTPCPSRLVYEELNSKDVDDLTGIAGGWLMDMELIRTKSKNLNGRLSGCLRDRIECMRSIIKCLAVRVKDMGDVTYLRRKNDELMVQIRESKKEESRLQSYLKEADAKIERLNTENFSLRRKIGSKSTTVESERSTVPVRDKDRHDTPKRNTPKKDLPIKKMVRRDSSVVESLQDCDERLKAISKCDEKIAKFEEILKQMKTDLYGSIEAIAEKVTRSVADPPKRGVPKIISNIQLVPPRPTIEQETEITSQEEVEPFSDLEAWTEVINKKKTRKRQVRIDVGRTNDEELRGAGTSSNRPIREPPPSAPPGGNRRRAPRNAAVAIKANPDGMTYAEIIKQAREKVDLKDLGIVNPRMRRAANGGVLIEIAGPEGASKADALAARLREAIGGSAAVSRPMVKADLRITGFDESVIKDEVITVVTEHGGCLASDIRVGPFRPMNNGLVMTWVQCPLSAALRVSRKGRVNLGWSVARVELMKAKPVQC